jgi:hypothetical protein
LAKHHESVFLRYKEEDKKFRQDHKTLLRHLGHLDVDREQVSTALLDAEQAWAESSVVITETGVCLYNAGRPDLQDALSDAVLSQMFDREFIILVHKCPS